MNTVALYIAIGLLLLVVFGVLRAVLEPRLTFFKQWDDKTRQPYIVLVVVAVILIVWSQGSDWLQTFTLSGKVGGFEAKLTGVTQRVDTISAQIEDLYKSKQIEIFNSKNWSEVHLVSRTKGQNQESYVLEVVLKQTPIVGSVEVFEGDLPMPEQEYYLEGRTLRFPANAYNTSPDVNATPISIKYYPRRLAPN